MSTTTVDMAIRMNAKEVFTASEAPYAASDAQRTLSLSGLAVSGTLGSGSTPRVDQPPVYKKISAAGTTTIDLTAAPCIAAPGTATRAVDMTGKKLKAVLIKCAAANAGNVTVAFGAANPYPLFGASKDVILGPGEVLALGYSGKETHLPAVSGAVKNIDVTTTGTDVVEVELLMGT